MVYFLEHTQLFQPQFFGRLAMFLERRFFPFLYAYFALMHGYYMYNSFPFIQHAFYHLGRGSFIPSDIIIFSTFFTKIILFLFNIMLIWVLIIRRNLRHIPSGALEVVIPLLVTLFFVFFNFTGWLPPKINFRIVPIGWLPVLSFFGFFIAWGGWIITAIALYQLRYSFGIFVQVRDIVTAGLYKYVRHPMYFGYVLQTMGLWMTHPHFLFFLQVLIFWWLLRKRALIEENKLAAFSPAYREYMAQVPPLIPFISIIKSNWARKQVRWR